QPWSWLHLGRDRRDRPPTVRVDSVSPKGQRQNTSRRPHEQAENERQHRQKRGADDDFELMHAPPLQCSEPRNVGRLYSGSEQHCQEARNMTSATWRLFERWRTARGYASQMAACEELGVERQAATYWKSG